MEKTFKFHKAERMFDQRIIAYIDPVDLIQIDKEKDNFLSRPRKGETIIDQRTNKYYVEDKIANGNEHKLILRASENNIEDFNPSLVFMCTGIATRTEDHSEENISAAMTASAAGVPYQDQKIELNFPSAQDEKEANGKAIKQIREITQNIDRPAQTKETEYAIKALQEAAMWLSKRNIEITRNKR